MNLSLIGYRGTGKSTVAQLLAQELGWTCVDADAAVEQAAGQTIAEIFATEGEAGFRARESQNLAEICRGDRQVVAWGGGVVLAVENRRLLRGSGKVVWLRAEPAELARRIAADPLTAARRPRLTGASTLAEIHTLLAQREPWYQETSDWQLATGDLSADQAAVRIQQWFERALAAQAAGA